MNINISGTGGDVVGVGVTGSGNIVGKNITVHGGIRLDPQLLARLPDEYATSLQAFTEAVNTQLQVQKVPAEKVEPLQKEVEALAKETEGIKPAVPPSPLKKATLMTKLAGLAKNLLKTLPDAAAVAATFTPLAPFSKLIGTGVEEIVKMARDEG
jgi:hypothetical protein